MTRSHLSTWRTCTGGLVAAIVGVGVFLAPVAAWATPLPDSGPADGGTTVTVTTPAAPTPEEFTFGSIGTGAYNSVGTSVDGRLYGWGWNGGGEIGDGTTTQRSLPSPVTMPESVTFTQTSARGYTGLGIGDDGRTYSWGAGEVGQLGNGTTPRVSPVPSPVSMPAGVQFTRVAAGGYHSLAIGDDGRVYAWGDNRDGQLGVGSTSALAVEPQPVALPADATFTQPSAQISAGYYHSLVIADDGRTFAWGEGTLGQLGTGGPGASSTPTEVVLPAGVTFTQVTAGGHFSLALSADGRAWAWGQNAAGQLGDGSMTNRVTPVEVHVPPGVRFIDLAAGAYHALARGDNGMSYAWGQNVFGQLGDGTTQLASTPQAVSTPGDVEFVALSAATMHSLALGTDGHMYSWGSNRDGALGDGTRADHHTPQLVQGPQQVSAVTAVNFGGEPGTSLTDNGDGTYSVATPAHAPCAADVSVEWTLDGVPQPPVSYPAGFMFTALPTVTDPEGRSATVGDSVRFEAATDGCPEPAALGWEMSSDHGASWEPITVDPIAAVTETGLSLEGVTLEHDRRQYRAIATNSIGSVRSAAATLTVAPANSEGERPDPDGEDPGDNPSDPALNGDDEVNAKPETEQSKEAEGASLAKTGSSDSSWVAAGGLGAILAGACMLVWIRAQRRQARGA